MDTIPIAKYFTRPLSLEDSFKTIQEKKEYDILFSLPKILYCYSSRDLSYVVLALPSKDNLFTQLFYFDKQKTDFKFCLTDDNKFSAQIFLAMEK